MPIDVPSVVPVLMGGGVAVGVLRLRLRLRRNSRTGTDLDLQLDFGRRTPHADVDGWGTDDDDGREAEAS